MRRPDDLPLDPEVARGLEAIEAALAGQPVESGREALAQLALVVTDDRPRMRPEFAPALDELCERRPNDGAAGRWRRWWMWSPAAALAACLLVAVVIVTQEGGRSPAATATTQARTAAPTAAAGPGAGSASGAGTATASPSAPTGQNAPVLEPPNNGRKITQSAQLALSVEPTRIDTVAQEVYDTVGQAKGVVSNSTVTAGGAVAGYAQFQLSVPSVSLPQTMAALSGLRYAAVVSRTDNTQDVNNEYQRDVRRLADARALRTSLLRQLAGATSQAQLDSLTARIHDAEASISSDEATLARLNREINYSQISLTINSGAGPVPSAGTGGFTLGSAAHTAGHVLTVAAGVILIAAAALVPLTALVALTWWAGLALRRRRREQALDHV